MKSLLSILILAIGLPIGLRAQSGGTLLVQESNLSGYAGTSQPAVYFSVTENADTLQLTYNISFGHVNVFITRVNGTGDSSPLVPYPASGTLTFPNVPIGYYQVVVTGTTNYSGLSYNIVDLGLSTPFFTGQVPLSNGVCYLSFPNGNYFGYYSYLNDPRYIYHFDLGYEYAINANDGANGVYFYDFKSGHFFYTSPAFGFPYLYDFTLKSTVYYYPDPSQQGHYNTNGVRYFYVYSTRQTISM